jgi:hypothetical protein
MYNILSSPFCDSECNCYVHVKIDRHYWIGGQTHYVVGAEMETFPEVGLSRDNAFHGLLTPSPFVLSLHRRLVYWCHWTGNGIFPVLMRNTDINNVTI